MKKMKALFCAMLLSTCLAGNVFAGNTTGNGGFFSFLNYAVDVVASYLRAADCPPRQCQNCKPGEDDGNGNCRPND